jgi:hypothetical protein
MVEPGSHQPVQRRSTAPVEDARNLLSGHGHFRGRLDHFLFEEAAGVLIVEGAVPTFYLKQLLQTILRNVEGVEQIINRVEVTCAHGLSSCSHQTRDRCALEYAWLGKVPVCLPTCDGEPGKSGDGDRSYVHSCLN